MVDFGGHEASCGSLEEATFVVLPVPYDLTSTYMPGSRKGPQSILEASANMELYDDELRRETYRSGIFTLPSLEIDARGPQEMIAAVEKEINGILDRKKIPVMLGGEHSISAAAVRALYGRHPGLSVLHLDAHADLRDSYQGSRYSHASVARRISEICPIVQAGIRSLSMEEAEFLESSNIPQFTSGTIREQSNWGKNICEKLTEDVYVTLDLDVLDPSLMPATGTPEPGGLGWWDVMTLLRTVATERTIRGFDVVELCPIPGMIAPDFTAAKLVYRLMGYIVGAHELSR
ncbi:MAG: agmatinase [Deltaproteobacteria bacterium]|nr:agmatinase [Deltaproteobacteria bacterium]